MAYSKSDPVGKGPQPAGLGKLQLTLLAWRQAMKILITGATGFIGGHLHSRLIKLGHKVVALLRPESDRSELHPEAIVHIMGSECGDLVDFFKQEAFDGVIHLATQFLSAHEHSDIPSLIGSNILLGTQVFDAATKAEVPWIINTSTFTQHFEDQDNSAVNLYSATKQAFEDIGKYYAEVSKSTIVTITLFDTFGPGDRRKKLLNLLFDASQTKAQLAMSPGEQILDISPIANVIDGYEQMINHLASSERKDLRGRVFSLKSNERMTLREFTSLFMKASGLIVDIQFGAREYRPREVMTPWTKGAPIPGWSPAQSLSEGIKEFIMSKKN
jgi:CDP-paratose synthetase